MRKQGLQIAGFAAVVAAIQMTASLTGNAYHLTQLTMSAYYSLVVLGLCILTGYAGQISIGHAGFFAIGGYLSALLTTHDLSAYGGPVVSGLAAMGILTRRPDLYGGELLTVHPWPACIFSVLAAVAIAFAIGGPVLRLKGHYLAMATLGFGIIVYRIVLGSALVGAADGIYDVPAFPLLPGIAVSGKSSLRVTNYYVAWGFVILGMVLLLNLVRSRVGRALASIHGAEDAAEAMGIPTARYKLKIFVVSAAFAAVAGVLLTHYNGGIGPSESSVMKSVRYLAIVAIGGMANLWGTLLMSLLLNYLSLRGYFGTYDDAVFGGILILIMLFAPDGLLRRHLFEELKGAVFPSGREKET
ncbi:MAG: branched-chain amino acid ABC transporter permease [Thermodesulfobacteriota bacterium]|nr:branched-chain amino acid ABC transporter permease [Thermodesulfobacteriota bacterium]